MSISSSAATMRVLSVMRHWITKHSQDFEDSSKLKTLTKEFLEDILCSTNLVPAEQKAATQLLRMLKKEDQVVQKINLQELMSPPKVTEHIKLAVKM